MPTVEEVTYEAGRSALSDQESIVSGIRQRTGTLLAGDEESLAHAATARLTSVSAPARGTASAWASISPQCESSKRTGLASIPVSIS